MERIWAVGAAAIAAVSVSNLAPASRIAEHRPAEQSRCFTPPSEMCTNFVIREIASAKSVLLIQAYVLSAKSIITAICDAKRNGVDVKLLLDKTNEQRKYAKSTARLLECGAVKIDDHNIAIAHNKVMVIDYMRVITGSFNLSTHASRNAENMLMSDDPEVVEEYVANWWKREAVARQPNTIKILGPLQQTQTPLTPGPAAPLPH